ncbi:MAG: hypothetical protein ACYST6_01380 [Planctomycetota bacterium]
MLQAETWPGNQLPTIEHIDIADPTLSPANDIDGQQRDPGPDIGADEWQP